MLLDAARGMIRGSLKSDSPLPLYDSNPVYPTQPTTVKTVEIRYYDDSNL
jgi:hypothetical protein